MTKPRIHLIFVAQKDLASNVALYTVVAMPVEGAISIEFPERSFTTIDDLETAVVPMISPAAFGKIRQDLVNEKKSIFECDADQAAALRLFSEQG